MGRKSFMTTMKLKELAQIAPVLNKIVDNPMKISDSFKVMCLVREVNQYFSILNEVQKRLVDKYCAKDEKGNKLFTELGNYKIDKAEEYNAELEQLLDVDVKLQVDKLSKKCIAGMEISKEDMPFVEKLLK